MEAPKKTIIWEAKAGGTLDTFEIGSKLEELGLQGIPVKTTKTGEFHFTARNEEEASTLLQTKQLEDGTEIATRTLGEGKCKGVIHCPAIKGRKEEDIKSKLSKNGVTEVKARGQNGTFVLTLNTPTLPAEIQVGALKVEVQPYIPRPLLCRQCFVYGHTQKVCRNKPACRKCGGPHSDKLPCLKPAKCRNCGGKHHPNDKACKVWQQEQSINEMMILHKIPGQQARDMYRTQADNYIIAPKIDRQERKPTPPINKPNKIQENPPKPTKQPKEANPKKEAKPAKPAKTSKPTTKKNKKRKAQPPTPITAKIDLTQEPPEDPELVKRRKEEERKAKDVAEYKKMMKIIYSSDESDEADDETMATTSSGVRMQTQQEDDSEDDSD